MKNHSVNQRLDYYEMSEKIDALSEKYKFLSVSSIGQTVLGKRIPILSVGRGERSVLYVGTQRGTEMATASCLLKYIDELCAHIEGDGRIYNCSAAYLFATRTVSVIPMLNPDGVDYCLNGIDESNPMYERFCSEGVNADFLNWNGNAMGVELRNNYGESFDDIESKQCAVESGSLRNYLMFNRNVKLVLTLSKGKNSVTYTYKDDGLAKLNSLGKTIANFCDTAFIREYEKGTLCGFCAKELNIPCYELSSEYRNSNDIFEDYIRLRQALFLAPTLV